MNSVNNISIKSSFTQLSIDIFVFKMAKLSDVLIYHEVKHIHISVFIKDTHLKFSLPILDIG